MVTYSRIDRKDIDWIIAWTFENLTKGDYIRSCILESAAEGNYYGVKAVEGERIVGFLTFKRGIAFTYPHPELEREIAGLADEDTVFNGDGIYVSPEYRRGGVGSTMTRMAREQMLELGGVWFLGELWIYPDGQIPSASPTEDYGITEFERTVPMFYAENEKYGLECAICGRHCRCGAVVRLVRLERERE